MHTVFYLACYVASKCGDLRGSGSRGLGLPEIPKLVQGFRFGVYASLRLACLAAERKRRRGLLPESQGQNLAVTDLHESHSLDIGTFLVPRRARNSGSKMCASLNSRLERNREEEEGTFLILDCFAASESCSFFYAGTYVPYRLWDICTI